MKITATLILALLAYLFGAHARAALGENFRKCNSEYGEKYHSRDDVFHNQNHVECYRNPKFAATVTYNSDWIAIEIRFTPQQKAFAPAQIQDLLDQNGTGWKKEAAKLGTAMNTTKADRWKDAEGRTAVLVRDGTTESLTISSLERLKQLADSKAMFGK